MSSRIQYNFLQNQTVATRTSSEDKLREKIPDHVELKVQLVFMRMYLYEAVGKTLGTLRGLKVVHKGADMQCGKGSKTHHASHPDPFSGFKDNVREKIAEMFACKGPFSAFCQLRHIDGDDLKGKSAGEIKAFLSNSGWKKGSVFQGTEFQIQSACTNGLPRQYNLTVDGKFEKQYRQKYAGILTQILRCELRAKDAIGTFLEDLKEYFKEELQKANFNVQKLAEGTAAKTKARKRRTYYKYSLDGIEDPSTMKMDCHALLGSPQKIQEVPTTPLKTPKKRKRKPDLKEIEFTSPKKKLRTPMYGNSSQT